MRSVLPKVLHPVANKPMVSHVIDTARQIGAEQLHLVYGHGAELLKERIAAPDLNWVLQAQQLSTGHAVAQAIPFWQDEDDVLVLYGDTPLIQPETLQRLLAAKADDGMALLTVVLDNPTGYGRIVRENGQVVGIVEQKDANAEQLAIREVNTGVLVANGAQLSGWLSRLVVYWAILSLGPLAIGVAMYAGGLLDAFFTDQSGWLSLFRAAPVIWNYLALWLVTFALYKLIPNTKVTFRPALFGALVAAILLELGKRALGTYFAKAVTLGQLYGSLGLIPVFMFWVYVMWLVILFGLEVSAMLQMLGPYFVRPNPTAHSLAPPDTTGKVHRPPESYLVLCSASRSAGQRGNFRDSIPHTVFHVLHEELQVRVGYLDPGSIEGQLARLERSIENRFLR